MTRAAAVACASMIAACAGAPSRAVRNDDAIVRIESLAQLRSAFNQHPYRNRILALASPT